MLNNGFIENIETSTNKIDDKFVGVSFKDNILKISMPIGFEISKPNNKKEFPLFRENLKLLLSTVRKYYSLRDTDDANADVENTVKAYGFNNKNTNFPIYSFDYLIKDYISNGYYVEKEIINKETNSGKINWNKTIKQEDVYFDNDDVFFLKFIRRKSNILSNELITLLHKMCVYESFEKWGFMYFDKNIAEKPTIKFKDAKKYIPFLKEKISQTFLDRNKQLFQHMLNIIIWSVFFSNKEEYKYGVAYFHPVWEMMIDKVFGIGDISKYYPQATWHYLDNTPMHYASNMRQDSIMEYNGELYVLDAKYYGIDKEPGTADTNKQITYGRVVESIDENKREPYNAYLLPATLPNNQIFSCNSYTIIDTLKDYNGRKYSKVAAVFVDTKKLMQLRYEKATIKLKKELIEKILLVHTKNDEIVECNVNNVIEIFKQNISSNKMALAAHIDLKIFEPIYKKVLELLDNEKYKENASSK